MRAEALAARLSFVLLLPLLAGCTFEDGRGFATLQSARLALDFDPGARAFQGSILSDQGYRVRLDGFQFQVSRVELLELGARSGAGTFNPASPPPGYSSCHGGHCHAVDGRLVPYAEVQAELSGGTASAVPVVTFTVQDELDLLQSPTISLGQPEPSAELPRATLSQVALHIGAIVLVGSIVPGETEDGPELPLSIELEPMRLLGHSTLEISRDGPSRPRLLVTLRIDGTLFDGVSWSSLAEDGVIRVHDPESPAYLSLSAALSRSPLTLTLEP